MRTLELDIELKVDADSAITDTQRAMIAENIGKALMSWAQSSESGIIPEGMDAVTRGVKIYDVQGRHLVTVEW